MALSLIEFAAAADADDDSAIHRRADGPRDRRQSGDVADTQHDARNIHPVVAAIRDGDSQVYEALFLEYHKRLWAFAYDLTASADTAEEIVQDVFTTLWIRRTSWTIERGIAEYLFGAVRNRAYQLRRHDTVVGRSAQQLASADLFLSYGTTPANPAEVSEQRELNRRIAQAVAHMPEGRRSVLLLRWREQLSYDAIAQIMGTTAKAVGVQLVRAREDLRRALRDVM